MTKKCSASHCISLSSRCSKISCAKCRKAFHLKCVGLSASQHKVLRDFPGAEWFCPACRNSPMDFEQSSINPALNLILTRLSSLLRLIGAQIDVTRTLCRALSDSNRRSSCMNEPRLSEPAPTSELRNFEDALNNIQFEFSNVFASFIADATNASDTNRDRTSSLSSTNVTSSRSGKRMRVDVSVDTSDIPLVTISSIPGDATASIPVRNASHTSDLPITAINTASSAASTASAIRSCASTIASTATASNSIINSTANTTATCSSIKSSLASSAAVTTTTSSTSRHSIASNLVIGTTSAVTTKPPSCNSRTSTIDCCTQTKSSSPKPPRFTQIHNQHPANATVSSASMNHATTPIFSTTITPSPAIQPPIPPSSRIIAPSISQPIEHPVNRPTVYVTSSGESTNTSNDSSRGSNINTKPGLSVVPATPLAVSLINSSRKWFYLTKFQPHETEANIISYIAHHAHCAPDLIVCHRLIRNGNERPLSFLSFKLSVPSNIEQILLADGFWPNGVSITAFLDRRSNKHKPIGAQKQTRLIRPTPILSNLSTPSSRLPKPTHLIPQKSTTTPTLRQEVRRVLPSQPTSALQRTIPCLRDRSHYKIRSTLV